MFYAVIQTPPGSTLEQNQSIAEKLQKIAEGIDGVKSVSSLAGYEILRGLVQFRNLQLI
jgi:HAE1 family hydrophobic/amphiphilic exporter-1